MLVQFGLVVDLVAEPEDLFGVDFVMDDNVNVVGCLLARVNPGTALFRTDEGILEVSKLLVILLVKLYSMNILTADAQKSGLFG